jgi:hypothetical protein
MGFAEPMRRLAAGVLSVGIAAAALASGAVPKGEIIGAWQGVSMCVKSPEFPDCHDESVEYDFYDGPGGTVHLAAYTFFDGQKNLIEEMDCTYDEKAGSWTSESQNPRYRGLWTFTVAGDALSGTLVDPPSKHKVRDLLMRRPAPPAN